MKRKLALFSVFAALSLTCAAPPSGALEISLEENRAERGNIGYVDMRKIFRLYPETHKAKQTYAEIVRQAEEQVNMRRGESLALRSELSRLRMERELLEKSPLAPESAPPAPEEAAPDIPAEAAEISTAPLSSDATAPADLSEELPGMGDSAQEKDMVINIPGVTEEPVVVAPPGDAPAPEKAPEPKAGEPAAPRAGETPLMMRERVLKELDAEIREKEAALSAKEKEFSAYQSSVEKNLIEIESRRSEILLGKIYKAVREVAQENGVSIVVDKNQILYGQASVDLTAKVLQKLKGLSL